MELIDGSRPKGAVGAEDGTYWDACGLSNARALLTFPSVYQIDLRFACMFPSASSLLLLHWGSCVCHLLASSLSASWALPSRGGDRTHSPRLRVHSRRILAFARLMTILPSVPVHVRATFLAK